MERGAVIALLGVGALTAGFLAGWDSPAGVVAGPAAAVAPAGREVRTWTGSGNPVTIAVAGDVNFEGDVRSEVQADPEHLFADVAPALSGADVTIANLETAITDRGEPAVKAYTFRAPPQGLTALKAAGVDVVTAANNHGLDYGLDGLTDTLAAAKDTGLPIIGLGNDETEAYRPYIVEVKGQRIGVLAASHVIDESLEAAWTAGPGKPGMANAMIDRFDQAVRELRSNVDTLVVYPHWGVESQTCPSDMQRVFTDRMYAAGADIVVGSHTHRVLGAGMHDGMFVGYGLGNFAFYVDDGPNGNTGIMTVTVTGRHVDGYDWAPGRISGGLPRLLTGEEAAEAKDAWRASAECTGLTP